MSGLSEGGLPRHIAFIMDGNGRWAKKRMMPRNFGHRQGAETLRDIAIACSKKGIEYMSVYAFSTENWSRPEDEVKGLMSLITEFFGKYAAELRKHNIRVKFMGEISRLPAEAHETCLDVIEMSQGLDGMTLNIGLNYGGRAEIARAAAQIARDVVSGKLDAQSIDEEKISQYLYTAGQPDVDILVRTGNESRLSGYMLYQCSYAEFFVLEMLWPDFNEKKLEEVLCSYKTRNRRFGNAPAPAQT